MAWALLSPASAVLLPTIHVPCRACPGGPAAGGPSAVRRRGALAAADNAQRESRAVEVRSAAGVVKACGVHLGAPKKPSPIAELLSALARSPLLEPCNPCRFPWLPWDHRPTWSGRYETSTSVVELCSPRWRVTGAGPLACGAVMPRVR